MEEKALVRHEDDLQMIPLEQAKDWYNQFVQFSKSILKKDVDYGVIPGTPKPTLLKAGAEKLRFAYGLAAEFECIDKTVEVHNLFIDYTYRCTVKSKSGSLLAQCEGNCNSMEPKFGYLWKTINELPQGYDISGLPSKTSGKKATEFDFAINKSETTGQYGKPQEYWDKWAVAIINGQARKIKKKTGKGTELDAWELDETVTVYRIPNPDVIGQKNTIMKMAQKRAFVGAMLIATGASEFFTQDIEDMPINGKIYSEDINLEPEFTDATIITTESNGESTPAMQAAPVETPKVQIPGHWYAKLEKCKTPDDVDELGKKHADTVNANPDLRKLFVHRKAELKNNKELFA